MFLLFPGRHHLLTKFQAEYLKQLEKGGLKKAILLNGSPWGVDSSISGLVVPITSANHHSTRRNPLPFYQRAMMVQEFSSQFSFPTFVYPIDDLGQSTQFAEYCLKKIQVESEGKLNLNPTNTILLCSSPVMSSYIKLGFSVLPVELDPYENDHFVSLQPWQVVEAIARNQEQEIGILEEYASAASVRFWKDYEVGKKVRMLFSDALIGDDGDLTESRDYNTYVREMDEIADLKFQETKDFIVSGRIGDIGCAVGSWIKLASQLPPLRESDFYGVEIARKLFDICEQRKENGDFGTENVFFLRKNAVSGLVFPENSMKTIHTSSLTHEIFSYGSMESLHSFIQNRYKELSYGGVWINRDVVGPENKDEIVYLWLNQDDGRFDLEPKEFFDKILKKEYLDSLSTFSRFFVFQREFRKERDYVLPFEQVQIEGKVYLRLKMEHACEFLSKKDYTDNWDSEMHEAFSFWKFSEWKHFLEDSGFQIHPKSQAYANPWILENRYKTKAEIFASQSREPTRIADLIPRPFPVTNMLLVGVKEG
ncbi:hypothetical protein LPTSP4_32320 [Leptospira ryugenii]|uniref:Transferase n=1 Tax=Leptospira ryugenii TaxID=1917863 RepID=A0A2P2E4C1_9LEPT|nr:transferase [Leptospira ryugenii]GBF51694.1 hypothetical protein LPTSP4_32320 [Leptospira ryugenii]